MESPKCPYCGEEMEFCDDGYDMSWYCPKCLAEAPVAHSEEAAYAAAMKREKKRKTYFEDFLQKHPKADMLHIIPLTGRDVPNLCRAIIYGETMNCPVLGCTACWNKEMEGEDE